MGATTNLSENKDHEIGSYRPSAEFLAFLANEISHTEDIYKNLKADKPAAAYEQLESNFIELRKRFKHKLQVISDKDYAFLTHSDLRKQATAHILECATAVAQRFQEARENNRLDRPKATDALENLINAIKNLKELSERIR